MVEARVSLGRLSGAEAPEGEAPFACASLLPLVGEPFELPADDAFVHGEGDAEHGYLDGARRAWEEHPYYMDFLDEDAPVHDLKILERDLYLHHWRPWWDRATRVLDVGCGVGRFALPLLERGATVWGVDPDLESLRHLVWRSAGRPGNLDVHWASADTLPDVEVDVALAVEVLCYVPDAVRSLKGIASRVRSGGAVLMSLEGRWGWATAPDAGAGTIEAALDGDGIVHEPGQGWVQTYTEARVRALCEEAGLECVLLERTHYLTDGPLEQAGPEAASLDEVLALEVRCRTHPVWRRLNRIWTVVARVP
jgi:SAM-dependent methyltransferase